MDPGSRMEKSRIRDKHPGSVTLHGRVCGVNIDVDMDKYMEVNMDVDTDMKVDWMWIWMKWYRDLG